jgi:hypothetical protein
MRCGNLYIIDNSTDDISCPRCKEQTMKGNTVVCECGQFYNPKVFDICPHCNKNYKQIAVERCKSKFAGSSTIPTFQSSLEKHVFDLRQNNDLLSEILAELIMQQQFLHPTLHRKLKDWKNRFISIED